MQKTEQFLNAVNGALVTQSEKSERKVQVSRLKSVTE